MRLETSSIKELANAHRMGHTCASLNGELLLVWGGSDESVAYLPARNNHLWIYDTLSGYWRHRSCSGECPPYLSGATSALIGQRMFVFGGHSSAQDNWMNSLYCLDLSSFEWLDVGARAHAQPTKPIRADKLVSWSYGGRLYAFGGYGWSQTEHLLELLDLQKDLQLAPDHRWPKFGWNNQLVEFNPLDSTWRWPSYSGRCPSARAAHSGALMGSIYYLFGGRDSRERLNDLYTLDMRTLTWTQVATFSAQPQPRLAPIRHLLEDDSEDHDDQDGPVAMGAPADELGGFEAPPSATMSNEEQELLLTSDDDDDDADDLVSRRAAPSSLALRVAQSSAPSEYNPSQLAGPSDIEDTDGDDGDDDDDDDGNERPDYPFDYPQPGHLLERWSLSSNPASSSATAASSTESDCTMELQSLIRLRNCGDPSECPTQEQQMEIQPADALGGHHHHNHHPQQQSSVAADGQGAVQMELAPDGRDEAGHASGESRHSSGNLSSSSSLGAGAAVATAAASANQATRQPTGRSFASFTPISEREILLYGGISSLDENLDDCWIYDMLDNRWTPIDLKNKHPRLWHTGAKTKNNEVVIIGGSNSDKIDEICTDILTISLSPKSLKRLALDAAARSIRMRTINRARGLPSTITKLIRLRKQAISISARRVACT